MEVEFTNLCICHTSHNLNWKYTLFILLKCNFKGNLVLRSWFHITSILYMQNKLVDIIIHVRKRKNVCLSEHHLCLDLCASPFCGKLYRNSFFIYILLLLIYRIIYIYYVINQPLILANNKDENFLAKSAQLLCTTSLNCYPS